jgi:Tfp pilus assembly protein PilV
MKTRAKFQAAGKNAFSLIECMIAVAIFFMCVFAIIGLISQSLQNARRLQRPIVDAGMLASELSLTNQLTEDTESGDFGDVYPGCTWTATTTEVLSNKLFEVDYVVHRPDSDRTEKMSLLLFRPQSKGGSMDGGPGIK